MSDGPEPERIAAERLLADPGLIRDRLAADLAEITAMGRTGVRVEPDTDAVTTLRASADRLAFRSSVEAATLSLRRLRELPVAERGSGSPIGPYHAAASATVAHGGATVTSPGRLVFRRGAAEVARTTVLLETVVEIDADDGRAWLESFGWPESSDRPVWDFGGSGGEYLDQAESDAGSGMPFDRVMAMVLGATVAGFDPAAAREQRVRIAEAVAARSGELAAYVADAESYALAVRANGWFGACLYRSALEALFEGFLGGAAFDLVDMDEIDEIDEALREAAEDTDPIPPGAVPKGMPSHYGWWTPKAP
ncbi:hypothetical protein [Actinomadura sp. DC4]|uniref:hypothetical protein n=1 Tax=Actinomadura sp. DC4 TaxID=3055069 RepID=UPI0025B0B8AD|nr:hypothetical protein [Actinomadura sp. DC4]MDN3358849.1 hypothetical protein [Actinomadura sp. DC4]